MDSSRDARVFEFGGMRLDVAQRRLFDADGTPIDLPSRAFDLLLYMVERSGNLLDKSEMMQAVWPKTVVEEGNLPRADRQSFQGAGEAACIRLGPSELVRGKAKLEFG